MIKLTTPKGKLVILNFDNVIFCKKTTNNHTSLCFNYATGNPSKSAYLVVVEDFKTILRLLEK
jgi:hypothetical protein